jgi:hypothetical protein
VNSTLRPGYRRLPLWTISRRPIRRITGYARLDRSSRAVISAAGSFRRTSSLLVLAGPVSGRRASGGVPSLGRRVSEYAMWRVRPADIEGLGEAGVRSVCVEDAVTVWGKRTTSESDL